MQRASHRDTARDETATVEPSAPSVAERLLGVLAAFDHAHAALSLSDIARRAGLPLATAHRMVARLVAWGALERGPAAGGGTYSIGLRLWEIGSLAPRGMRLRETVLPYLEDLYEATHENVQLAVLDGLDVVYVERLAGRSAVGVLSRVGLRWPAHATGVGLVLLAYSPADVQNRACAAPLTAYTPHTISDAARLRRELAEVRRSGSALSDRQVTDDAVSVAAPVRGPGGDVVAAVSVVVHAENARPAELTPAVRVAALGASRALGWRPSE